VKSQNIPEQLRRLDQWLGTRAGEKRPVTAYHPHHYASTGNPQHYATFDAARDAIESNDLDGIGFAVTEYDGFVIVDLDACRNKASGVLSDFARRVVDELDSYTEASRSGTGLHIVVESYTSNNMKSLNTDKKIEVFSTKGFVILTGEVIESRARVARVPRERMREFMRKHRLEAKPERVYETSAPPELTPANLDSDEAALTFGPAAHALLVTGNEDDLALVYPREAGGELDRSRTIYAMVHECHRIGVPAADCYTWLASSPWVSEYMTEKSENWLWRYNVEPVYLDETGDTIPSDEAPKAERSVFVAGDEAVGNLLPVDWLIERYVERDASGLMSGAHSTYKSTVALDWSLCVATGTPWKGHRVSKGNVVYIAGEGQTGLAKRVKAWCIENDSETAGNILLSRSAVQVMDTHQLDAALAEIDAKLDGLGWTGASYPPGSPSGAPGPAVDLVVVDTLNKNFAGGDENNAGETAAFFNRLTLSFPGACVLVVHHLGKDTSKGSRGSSAIEAGADYVYRTKLVADRTVKLTCSKMKDADKANPVDLLAVVHEFEVPSMPDEVLTGVTISGEFAPVERPDDPEQVGPWYQVRAMIEDNGGAATVEQVRQRMRDDEVDIGTGAPGGRNYFRDVGRWLKGCVDEGLLSGVPDAALTNDGRGLAPAALVSVAGGAS